MRRSNQLSYEVFSKDLNSNSIHRKKSWTHRFYENSLKILAEHDQKLKMQVPASAKSFASNYCYQFDILKLSRDQKQYFNRDKGNITLK